MAAFGKYWNWDLFWLVLAFAAAGVQKMWRGYVERRSETWPISYGRVDKVSVDSQDKYTKIKCYYSYSVGTERFTGSFQKRFDDADRANAWAEAIDKKQVPVRYDPASPSRSQLRESDLEPLVQAAAPYRQAPAEEIPVWQQTLAVVLLGLSIAGLAVSVAMLLEEYLGRQLVPSSVASWTNAGAFVIFFGGLWIFRQTKKRARAAPGWMKFLGYALFYYALLVAVAPHGPRRDQQNVARRRDGIYDARYMLILYYSTFEWCYGQLQGREENASQGGLGELH